MIWCTYSYFNKELPQHIGKATNITKSSCYIQYSEGQLYAKHAWDKDYVKMFESLEGAICYMYTNSDMKYLSEIKQDLSYSFVEDAKTVNWDTVLRPLKIKKMLKMMTF
jgi:hypothetical protein